MTVDLSRDPMVWLVVAVAAAVIILAAAAMVASKRRSRVRTARLRGRFGPEYDRAVEQIGDRAHAERELVGRLHRVDRLRFHEFDANERARFESSWTRIQAQFVDDPAAAVAEADELVREVMRARGYPEGSFDERAADLSVDHAGVVQHYRAAQALSATPGAGPTNTEELRQAVVHYRALFADLLHEPPGLHPH